MNPDSMPVTPASPRPGAAVVPAHRIQEAIERIAGEIRSTYDDPSAVVGIVVLEGARRFADALFARLGVTVARIEVRAASYHGSTRSSGTVEVQPFPLSQISGRDVLLVDDIYDSGRTLSALVNMAREAGAASVRTCVLLRKNRAHQIPVHIDFRGVEVEDRFLVGFGLDYAGKYRDLDFIAALEQRGGTP